LNAGLLVVVFLAYVVAGKLGLSLAFAHASASPVWPPTGIALATLLLTRYRVWPAILLGAFVVNATTEGSLVTSAGIAVGNTLEGVLGAWLVTRFAGGRDVFHRAGDVFRFAFLAAFAATALAATVGVTTLALGGYAPWARYGSMWVTWWLGDAAGALVVAPALLLWVERPRLDYAGPRGVEAAALSAATVVVGLVLFAGGLAGVGMTPYPLSFLALPTLLWATFRFGPREASALLLVISAIATWGTVRGVSIFAVAGTNESLLLLQAFLMTAAGIALPTAAMVEEHRRDQQRLATSEATYRSIFEENPHPMWVVERGSGRFLAVNEAAVAHYGWTRDEFLRMVTDDIRPPEDLPRLAAARGRLREGQAYLGRHRHRTKAGALIDVEVTAHLVSFEGRAAALILAYDVTEQARAQMREYQARAEAEEANRSKDEFLATLSHELRTPLNAMLGWVSMLRAGQLDAAAAPRALETIERNTRLQARLIEDLLDLSRITAGKLALDLKPVALDAVIAAAVETVRPAATARSIDLRLAIEPAPPVLGDAARLQQVVGNLVSNAVKFSAERGRVTIRLTRGGDRVAVSVTDSGEGIEPEFLPHVFDRFRQAEASTTRRHGGLGLGLTIARHLVERHGGTIRAESAGAGRGATFVVELPVAPAAVRTAGEERREGVSAALDGLSILIIDDDADTRALTAMMVEKAGATPVAVSSAAEGYAALAHGRFDAVIADIGMPDEDGYDLIRVLRKDETTRELPVVAFTAYASRDDARRAVDAGYDAHVPKPVEPPVLVSTVAAVVSRRRAG
jgi:PAS domain S-box-containing protein